RSLPLVARSDNGSRHTYPDPRLQREVGVRATLEKLDVNGPVAAVAGVPAAQLGKALDTSGAVEDRTVSAAGAIRVLAEAIEGERTGLVVAVEQATISVADLAAGEVTVTRDEVEPRELPRFTYAEGNGIPI